MTTSPRLVDAAWLDGRRSDPDLVLVDATVHLTFVDGEPVIESARDSYLAEHLDGAIFIDQLLDLSDADAPVRFTPVSSERFAETLGAAGVGDDSTVVIYDQGAGLWATRLWWHLGYEGFDRASVLDGGLKAWKSAGRPTEAGEVTRPPATFTARRRPERFASTEQIEAALDDDRTLLINALSPTDFAAARIPGSVNVPAADVVGDDGAFKDAAELRRMFAEVGALDPAVTPITYCGGGIAATATAFALLAAGRDDVIVYDGSMTAWTAGGRRPIEHG